MQAYNDEAMFFLKFIFLIQEEGFIVKSRWSDVQIPEMNLADYVWEDIEHNAANPALVGDILN